MISIHAPRVGCDDYHPESFRLGYYFNPRTPCGVRPVFPGNQKEKFPISIHAPRVGCDLYFNTFSMGIRISIHAPRVGCDAKEGHAGIW